MFYRNFSLLTVFVLGFFLLSFVSSALIGDCRDINSDVFGVTNTLTRDINGWSGTCFPLTEAADGNSFELDCDRFSIDANSDGNFLFDTVTLNIDTIIFRNCDINLFGSNVSGFRVNSDVNYIVVSDSNVDANDSYIVSLISVTDSSLEINLSNNVWNVVDDAGWMYLNANIGALSIDGLDINLFENNYNMITILTSDLNNLNLLNSSIIGSTDAFGGSSFISFNSVTDSLLDLNFSGSDINLPNNLYFFSFAGSNISELTITDLNLINFESATSFIFTNATSDLNTVTISNSNLVLNDQVFFDDAINVSDDFLNFDFSNTDTNYLLFTDLNLDLTSMGVGEYFISATDNSDLNYVAFTGANTIDLNSTNFFLVDSTADDYLNFDFTNSTVDVEDGVIVFSFTDSNISTFETSDLNVSASPNYFYYNINNSDLNSVLLLDSNVFVSGDAYFANLASTTDSEIDWNFSGTVIDINVNATGAGFYFSSSNYDAFSIYDLTSLTYADSGSALFKVLGSSDVNTFTFLNSVFDISSNSTFYDAAPTTQDIYLSFDFNNTDVNYLKFSDLNLSLTEFSAGDSLLRFTNTSDVNFVEFSNTSATQDSGTSFVQFDTLTDDSIDLNFGDANVDLSMAYLLYISDANVGAVTVTDLNYTGTFSASLFYISETDVNNLNILDSTVNDNSGNFVVFKNNNDSEVDLNFSGTVLDLSSNSGSFIDFEDTNQGTVNVYNADLTSSGLIAFYVLDNVGGVGPMPPESVPTTDVNTINILDSNFVFDGNWFIYSEDITDVELDVNFSGSDINLTSASGLYFNDSNYTTGFGVYSLTAVQTDANFFTFVNSLIAGLNILDSNISLDNFADVNSDANVQSGTISNNKFWDSNTSNTFIFAEDGRFNADFNSILEEDYNKRILWLSTDDTNNVGGNLWVDSTGDNLCGEDIVSPFGICDSAYNILGSDINYSDALPLRDYDPQDLNVTNIDFNAEPIIYGESVDINATIYNNSSGGSTDTNYFLEYYIDGVLDANYELNDVIASGASIVNTHTWDSNIAGDVNVYACVNYPLDTNTLNDCTQQTLTVTPASEPPSGGGKLKCSVSPTLTVTGDISDTAKANVTVKLSKSGGKDLDDGKMALYLATDSGDEEIWSKDVGEEDLDSGKYTETLQYGVVDLEKIDSDIYNLVDVSGNANFKLVASGCGEDDEEKTSSAKVEYFKSEIKEVYFLDNGKKIDVEMNDTIDLDVDKTYTLFVVLNTKTINKSKNIDLEMINETEDKTAAYWSGNLSWHESIKESDTEYSEKINVLNLMPHSKAKNFIFDILDLNKQDPEDKKKVDEIVKKLSDEFQSSEANGFNEYYLDFDYISFGSATENIILKYFEGDIVKDSFSFAIEFEHESENDSENPNKNNQGNKEGSSGEVSSTASGGEEYFVNYKKKLGLGETQEFTILNSEKSPISNLNMIVYFEDKNWQFKTDAKGKVLFTPEFEGEYSFGVPYPEEKVKGTFEVIEGYISSDSDFVEESGSFFSGWSDTAKKSFLAVIIVVSAVLVFVLYRLLRPKKKYGLESLSGKI